MEQVDRLMDDNLKFNSRDRYDSDSDEVSRCDRGDERRSSRRRVGDEREVVTSQKSGKSNLVLRCEFGMFVCKCTFAPCKSATILIIDHLDRRRIRHKRKRRISRSLPPKSAKSSLDEWSTK